MPIGEVSISARPAAAISLPNRIFTCVETEQQLQCQADIQGRSLRLELAPDGPNNPDLHSCQAQYDGQSVGCKRKMPLFPESFEVRDLGLSPQQLQAVRQKYWGLRTLLALREHHLLLISSGLSVAGGAIAAYFAWSHPNRLSTGLAIFAWGFIVYSLSWGFLASIRYETVAAHGITIGTWIWAVNSGAAAIGIVAALAIALLFRQRRATPATKAIVTVSSGLGTILIAGRLLLLILLGSGFVD